MILCRMDRLGGSFAEFEGGGRTLQIGPRFLELGYEDDVVRQGKFSEYVPSAAGHRRFMPAIRDYLTGFVVTQPVSMDDLYVVQRGRRVRDFLFSVDITTAIDLLSSGERRAAEKQLSVIVKQYGESGVREASQLAQMTLNLASLANHGETFHERIMAPLGNRIANDGMNRTRGDMARKLWLTLFYPGTLLEALQGGPVSFRPNRRFEVPEHGFRPLIASIVQRVRQSGGHFVDFDDMRSLREGLRCGEFVMPGGDSFQAVEAIVVAANTSELATEPSEADRFVTTLAWIVVDGVVASENLPVMMHFVDDPSGLYRVTRTASEEAIYCAEYAGSMNCGDVEDRVARDLRRVLPEIEGHHIEVIAAKNFRQPYFSSSNIALMERQTEEIRKLCRGRRVFFTGALAAIGADSFNEQIVQGLVAAANILGVQTND